MYNKYTKTYITNTQLATPGHGLAEAATEMVFQNICSFFPGASNLFTIFQEGLSVRRTDMFFFKEGLYVFRTDANFPGGFIEHTCFFKKGLYVHRTDLIISSNRY